jgi:hypothetical protein
VAHLETVHMNMYMYSISCWHVILACDIDVGLGLGYQHSVFFDQKSTTELEGIRMACYYSSMITYCALVYYTRHGLAVWSDVLSGLSQLLD